MGRRRQNTVYKYFSYHRETNCSTCLIPGCKVKVKGQHGANLLRHLACRHSEECTLVTKRNQLIKNAMANNKLLLARNIEDSINKEGTAEKDDNQYHNSLQDYEENELVQMEDHNLIFVSDDPLARVIEEGILNDATSEKNNIKVEAEDTRIKKIRKRNVQRPTSPSVSLSSVQSSDHKSDMNTCYSCKSFYHACGNTDDGIKLYGELIASELKHILPCMRTQVYVEILKLIQNKKYEHINSDDNNITSPNE